MLDEILTPLYYIGGFLIGTFLCFFMGYCINRYLTPRMNAIVVNAVAIISIVMLFVCMIGAISASIDIEMYTYFGGFVFFFIIYLSVVSEAMKSMMR